MMKTLLLTGSNGGISKGIISIFYNWNIIGLDIHPENLNQTNIYHQTDLTNSASLLKTCSLITENIDLVIHCAAIQICKNIWEYTEEEWDKVYACNVKSIFLLTKYLINNFKRNKTSIINIGSVHSIATSAKISPYASSKAAIVGLTKNMAIDLAPFGIRVNAISPGAIDTPMLRDGLKRNSDNPDKVWDEFNLKHPLGKVGTPEDIGKMCLFLAENNNFITGSNFIIDGGVLTKLSTE